MCLPVTRRAVDQLPMKGWGHLYALQSARRIWQLHFISPQATVMAPLMITNLPSFYTMNNADKKGFDVTLVG